MGLVQPLGPRAAGDCILQNYGESGDPTYFESPGRGGPELVGGFDLFLRPTYRTRQRISIRGSQDADLGHER